MVVGFFRKRVQSSMNTMVVLLWLKDINRMNIQSVYTDARILDSKESGFFLVKLNRVFTCL